jgi:hypothetical protein
MGLSESVENAVEPAVTLTASLVSRILNGEWLSKTGEREEKKSKKGISHVDEIEP